MCARLFPPSLLLVIRYFSPLTRSRLFYPFGLRVTAPSIGWELTNVYLYVGRPKKKGGFMDKAMNVVDDLI